MNLLAMYRKQMVAGAGVTRLQRERVVIARYWQGTFVPASSRLQAGSPSPALTHTDQRHRVSPTPTRSSPVGCTTNPAVGVLGRAAERRSSSVENWIVG